MKRNIGFTIRKGVFWPMAILLTATVVLGLTYPEQLYYIQDAIIGGALDSMGWVMMLLTNLIVLICLWICLSKHGDIKLGDKDAKPTLSTWSWITMAVCSGAAAELFLWGTSQPLSFFINGLPERGIEPLTEKAAVYAVGETGFMWTYTAYACYAICGIAIGFAVHNQRLPYKMSSALYPIFGKRINGAVGSVVDVLSFFAMAGSVAAVVGICSMSIMSGLNMFFGIPNNTFGIILVALILMAVYVYTSYTGVDKGINLMADINTKLYIVIMLFVLIAGPTIFIAKLGTQSFGFFLGDFMEMAHYTSPIDGSDYPRWWTLFCWAGWLGAAPMVGMFQARLAKGRTLRQCIIVNMLIPATFSFIWFCVFGGTGIFQELQGKGLGAFMEANGMEAVVFEFFRSLPLTNILIVVFILGIFISAVTMCNSTTTTVASLSVRSKEGGADVEPPKLMKIFWGVVMALVAIVNLLSGKAGEITGIDATKQITTLTGIPVTVFIIFMLYCFLKSLMQREKYDVVSFPQTAQIDADVQRDSDNDD